MENLGAHLNAYTSREQTVYYAKVGIGIVQFHEQQLYCIVFVRTVPVDFKQQGRSFFAPLPRLSVPKALERRNAASARVLCASLPQIAPVSPNW